MQLPREAIGQVLEHPRPFMAYRNSINVYLILHERTWPGRHQTAARHRASWCATSRGFSTVTWSVKVPAIASSSSEDDRLPLPADLQAEAEHHVSARHLQLHSAWVQVGIFELQPLHQCSVCLSYSGLRGTDCPFSEVSSLAWVALSCS